MRVDRRLLGWGLFFIIAGSIPLLTRAGYLDANLVGRWASLWPTLLTPGGSGCSFDGPRSSGSAAPSLRWSSG
jgi:hypothetical protein